MGKYQARVNAEPTEELRREVAEKLKELDIELEPMKLVFHMEMPGIFAEMFFDTVSDAIKSLVETSTGQMVSSELWRKG